MTKPPPRREDDDEPRVDSEERNASGGPASSSHEVPGRLNFNVPLTPGASVKLGSFKWRREQAFNC